MFKRSVNIFHPKYSLAIVLITFSFLPSVLLSQQNHNSFFLASVNTVSLINSGLFMLISFTIISLVVIALLFRHRKSNRNLQQLQEEILRLTQNVQSLEKETDIAQRTKHRFLANISHEVRTPLNGIFGLTSQLKKEKLSPFQAEMLSDIELLTQNLHALVSDVLDFTKLETGRLELDRLNFHLMNELSPILNFYRKKCQEKGLAFTIQFDNSLPLFFLGDPNRLRQIVNSLLSNALKFTNEGGIHFSCRFEALHAECFDLKIEISDSGKGIPLKQQKLIWDVFHQVNISNSRETGGIGIGLTLSKRLVELMGGSFEFTSDEGKGSTFWFTVCLPKGTVPDLMSQNSFNRILLVEDNLINQRVSMYSLRQQGFEVDVADNGQIAVDKYLSSNYDLILMDIQMPVMDGLEATRMIRSIEKERKVETPVKIVAITANALGDDRQNCLEAGIDGFLTKPFNLEKLPVVISHLKDSLEP